MNWNIFAIRKRPTIARALLPAVMVAVSLVSAAPAMAATIPTVTSVTNPLLQGFHNVAVTVTGTGFSTGATVKVSGTGVKLTSQVVISTTTITAEATVTATAALGARNVTVTTSGGSATCKACVTITPLGGSLKLSPTDQSVASGNDVTVDVMVNTASYSINTVQSVFTYSPTHFSLVSIRPGSAFGIFSKFEARGSIEFVSGNNSPVAGTRVAAVITLKATGTGNSYLKLPALCPPDDYAISCSAAYDATTGNNDLSHVFGSTEYIVT